MEKYVIYNTTYVLTVETDDAIELKAVKDLLETHGIKPKLSTKIQSKEKNEGEW